MTSSFAGILTNPQFEEIEKRAIAASSERRYYDHAFETFATKVRGQDVLIIGGASEWEYREECGPIHVRINNHGLRQGGPLDVLFHTCCDSARISELTKRTGSDNSQIVFLSCADTLYEIGRKPRPDFADYLLWNERCGLPAVVGFFAPGWYEDRNPYGPQHEWLHDIQRRVGGRLFTGLIALAYVLRTEARTIRLTGMDLFIDSATEAVRDGIKVQEVMIESHLLAANVSFLREAARDGRVSFARSLERAMKDYEALGG